MELNAAELCQWFDQKSDKHPLIGRFTNGIWYAEIAPKSSYRIVGNGENMLAAIANLKSRVEKTAS